MTGTPGLGVRAAELVAANAAAIPGTGVEAGLTAAEFDGVEQRFGFAFADDHREFLATVLPVGPRWPDWRHGDDTTRLFRI